MNKTEQFALSTGSKISKPFIYTTYFPIPFERYITFHSEGLGSGRSYDFVQDCINILSPILQKNDIRLVQIGDAKDRPHIGCINLLGQATPNQLAYLISKSLLHFGVDGFPIHVASVFDIPLVALFAPQYAETTGPYFGDKSKQILLKSYEKTGLKPSFNNDENPKTINLIHPEEIANAVCKLLNLNFVCPFETVYMGRKYSGASIQESIPNHKRILFNPEFMVEIRTDLGYDEQCFIHQLSNYKKSFIIIDQPINVNLLKQFKPHIQMVIIMISDDKRVEYIQSIREAGIKFVMISKLPAEEIQKLKIHYYEYGNINKVELAPPDVIVKLQNDIGDLYYRSAKITASEDKFFYSFAAKERGIPMNNHFEYQKVIDSPAFWENLEFLTIIKLKKS